MGLSRFSCHNHTHYSNLRFLDALSTPRDLIDRAIELGMCGIAITDHESLSASIEVNKYAQELAETHPDFRVAIGNEIYLVDERCPGRKYFHFILIAKDAIGHRILREQSSTAWLNGYQDRGLFRVPTTKDELRSLIEKHGRGHLIATSACIGGEVSSNLLGLIRAEESGNKAEARAHHGAIVSVMRYAKELFGDDFYLEVAPACYDDQIAVNNRMTSLAKAFSCEIVAGDDSHRLSQDQWEAHKAFLNSRSSSDREAENFYKYTYLQNDEDFLRHMARSEKIDVDAIVRSSQQMCAKIEPYSLLRPQRVMQVPVPDMPKKKVDTGHPIVDSMFESDEPQERYWANYVTNELHKRGLDGDKRYMDELEYEADIQKTIGEKLGTCIFAYPIFLQHYISMFWECGTVVGAGRGSSSVGLNHYLLGITQIDPIKYDLPYYWRFLNKERVELPERLISGSCKKTR